MSKVLGLAIFVLWGALQCAALPDLGYAKFNCDTTPGSPKSVHEVRPADLKIVAAIGDSLSAGYGAAATSMEQMNINYRGLTFVMGGDLSLEQHVTVPNVLKKFNPQLFGQSFGQSLADDWSRARLDAAVGGAKAIDMIGQAKDLVARMKAHPDQFGATSNPNSYGNFIEQAIKYFYDNVPRTIVSVVSMLNIQLLTAVDETSAACRSLHQNECACDGPQTAINVPQLCTDYQAAVEKIQNEGLYEKNDFTVVVQPAFEHVLQPKLSTGSIADTGFFAPDCFHFSQYGHAIVAKVLWNNLMQPVGSKISNYNLTDTSLPLLCPDQVLKFTICCLLVAEDTTNN